MMDNTKEYILCAAILRKEPKDSGSYHNNDIDYIEIGYRHHDIRNRFPNELDLSPMSQGFYTSRGRFVSREKAEEIARRSGQVNGDLIGGVLTSEDLY